MDILLSFKTMITRSRFSPMSLIASKASPPVSAPSPMSATTWYFSPFKSRARANPTAADSDVLLCPTVNASYGLSSGLGKPDRPPFKRMVSKRSRRPVTILCVYAWCPTSKTILSVGASNT